MSQKLTELFNDWEFNPLHSSAVYVHTKNCLVDFIQEHWTSGNLYDLGMTFRYEDIFDKRRNVEYDEEDRADYTEQMFLMNRMSVVEALFLKKIEEQKQLQQTVKLLYFLQQADVVSDDKIQLSLSLLGDKLESNESLLENICDDHINFCEAHGTTPTLTIVMAEYKSYNPKTINIPKEKPELLIPFIQRQCKRLNQSAHDIRNLKCFLVHRQLAYFKVVVMRENIQFPDQIDEPASTHQKYSRQLNQQMNNIKEEFNHADILNESLVMLAQTTFPKFANRITVPNSSDLKL